MPRNVRLSEAPSFGKPILLYDVASKGARSYLDLAREFLARQHGRRPRPRWARDERAEAKGAGARPGGADPGRALPGLVAGGRRRRSRRPRESAGDGTRTIAIEDVHPSPGQPRKTFDDARLEELAASIRTQGIIQPLIVRTRAAGGYELIAGERRWRAAQRAGLHEVPAVVRDVAPAQAFEMALVENLQREDLNPIEEAAGYERLIAEFGYTQEKLADRVGKERSTVANALRLLRLPDGVRDAGRAGAAVDGARARAARPGVGGRDGAAGAPHGGRRICRCARSRSWSGATARTPAAAAAQAGAPRPGARRANARDLGLRLTRALGTRVDVNEAAPGRGHIAIHYHSLDQLDALIERLVAPR